MSRFAQQVSWVLGEFVLLPFGRDLHTNCYSSGYIETALGGEDALDRAHRYGLAFPGRGSKRLRETENANVRLRKLLAQLTDLGVLSRRRIAAHRETTSGGFGWCYTYALNEVILNDLKNELTTPEAWAVRIAEERY